MDENNPLVLISNVHEFMAVHDFLENDEHVAEALELVIKAIGSKELPSPAKAAAYVVKLQGLSAQFAIKATVYSTLKKDRAGTEYNMRKNVYYTLAEQMDKLAAAMKIVAKV